MRHSLRRVAQSAANANATNSRSIAKSEWQPRNASVAPRFPFSVQRSASLVLSLVIPLEQVF